jgi:hypothetical protein
MIRASAVIALFFLLASCSAGAPSQGSSTVGNPRVPKATQQLLYVVCGTINRCDSRSTFDSCSVGLLSAFINAQLGAPSSCANFSAVQEAEALGQLNFNSAALEICSSSINSLSCGDPLVLGAYNPSLSNPYAGAGNLLPLYGSCSSVLEPAIPVSAPANALYVRAGASGSGDGSDWANACPGFSGTCAPVSMKRNSTYYVASGDYGSGVDFNAPGIGLITIRKATVSNHGTDSGWQASYGAGPARFGGWTFSSSGYFLDGSERSTPTSGHGFQLNMPVMNPGCGVGYCNAISFSDGADIDGVTIHYTEIVGFGASASRDLTGIYVSQTTGKVSNFRFSFGYLHDFSVNNTGVKLGSGILTWTLENTVLARILGPAISDHASSNVTLRNNLFQDISGSATVMSPNAGGSNTVKNWAIYGNVFRITDPAVYGSVGVIACYNNNLCQNWRIYNNTIVGYKGPGSGSGKIDFTDAHASSSGNVALNNLWYDSVVVSPTGSSLSSDYNTYFSTTGTPSEAHGQTGTGDPFVNLSGGDYHLMSATNPGSALPAPFHLTPDGLPRDSGGGWNRGAY